MVTGLVWTEVGGQVQFIECSALPSGEPRGGQLHLTGQLGDVIKESAQIALSWVRAREGALGLGVRAPGQVGASGGAGASLGQLDVHIHLPQVSGYGFGFELRSIVRSPALDTARAVSATLH